MISLVGSEDWSETDWRASLDHQVSDGLMAFATVSKAYSSGAFNHIAVPDLSPANQSIAATDPEEVVNTEIGIRSDWFNDRLRLNFTYFDMDFKNRQGPVRQVSQDGTESTVIIEDLGDVASEGWELEATVAATDYLTFNFAAGHTKAEYLEPSPPIVVHIWNTPENSYNIGLRYARSVGPGELSWSMNYSWQDDYYDFTSAGTDQDSVTEDYGLLNGRIEYYLPARNLTLALAGRNLTDEVYASHNTVFGSAFSGPPGPPTGPVGTQNWVRYHDRGVPRELFVSVQYDFGNN
jgi:iron complex outermembrane receptor protein